MAGIELYSTPLLHIQTARAVPLDFIGNLHSFPCMYSIVLIGECDHCPHKDRQTIVFRRVEFVLELQVA
jgi:hypothetical protein